MDETTSIESPSVEQTASEPANTEATQSAVSNTETSPVADKPEEVAAQKEDGWDGDRPFLGEKKEEKEAGEEAEKAAAEKAEAEKSVPDEKEYLEAVKKDESVFGKNDSLVFDQRLVKSVIPVCQKYGVSTEAANAIANAFAKAQYDAAREAYKSRSEYFAKMTGEARAKYSDADFEQINRGIDARFKPGGAMNFVIRNSELGSDPEFLALMHELGAAHREDSGKGAAEAAGDGGGDANGIAGLSKIW